jgi:hypothetical protein
MLNTDVEIIRKTIKICLEKKRISLKEDKEGWVCTVLKWHIYQPVVAVNFKHEKDGFKVNFKPVSSSLLFSSLSSPKDKENLNNKSCGYPPEFEEFWTQYPRRISKADAFRVWFRITKKEKVDPNLILEAVNGYVSRIKKDGTEEKYVKHPATFLNADRWRDFLKGGAARPKEALDPVAEANRMIKRTGGTVGVNGEKL